MSHTYTSDEVIALLNSPSPKCLAILVYLRMSDGASTGEIASSLGWDRSNTGRRLETLADQGLVRILKRNHNNGLPGRPTRIWAIS